MLDAGVRIESTGVSILVNRIIKDFGQNLHNIQLGKEFYYKHLPLCVIDAVWSLGVNYRAVENVVCRWCRHAGWARYRNERGPERSISDFWKIVERCAPEKLAACVFRNRQRTSPRNGILKADAVVRWARIMREHGFETFADFRERGGKNFPERDIKEIPGQRSGKSIRYFYMLAGDEKFVKPDRMLTRYVEDAIGRTGLHDDVVAKLVREAAHSLRSNGFDRLTPRKLDYAIWDRMSGSSQSTALQRSSKCQSRLSRSCACRRP